MSVNLGPLLEGGGLSSIATTSTSLLIKTYSEGSY